MGPHLQREVGPLHGLSHPSSRCSPWASTGCLQARSHSRRLWCRFLTPPSPSLPLCQAASFLFLCFLWSSGYFSHRSQLRPAVVTRSYYRVWKCSLAPPHPRPRGFALTAGQRSGGTGEAVLCAVLRRPRQRQRVYPKCTWLTTPKSTWPRYTKPGEGLQGCRGCAVADAGHCWGLNPFGQVAPWLGQSRVP